MLTETQRKQLTERILAKAYATHAGCLLWTGKLTEKGYGLVSLPHSRFCKPRRVHKVLWELTFGPLKGKQYLRHTCGVRHCIRLDHLEVATMGEPGHGKKRLGLWVWILTQADQQSAKGEW